ncbi:MAG: TerC family protein [Thermomicrobiales bacterium]
MFDNLAQILSIVVIDLVLSGDNAIVIGMAARNLSEENRRKAILLGGAGAIGLRILFTVLATVLLGIQGLQAIGALLLVYIAFKLLRPHDENHGNVHEADTLSEAVRTIILADVIMSLDNILAVGGAAHGHLGLLIFGLMLSIPILLFGSELVARLLGRFPAVLYVGVLVLIHSAVTMFFHDHIIASRVHTTTPVELAITLLLTGLIVGVTMVQARQRAARVKGDLPAGA